MSTPDVSVVIPTHARNTRLSFALEALAAQTLRAGRFEVVVVYDGPAGGATPDAPEGLQVRFVELPQRRGPGGARNAGWRAAEAPLVAFTDSDCRPSPRWLEALLAAADGDAVIVQGRTEPDPDERHLLYGTARSVEVPAPTNWFDTCNMLYPRALLERVGGFDEDFREAVEDSDLGLRALAAGCRPAWAGDALVWHAVHVRSLPAAMREAQRWRFNALLFARHPYHREALHRRLFWQASHERLTAVLATLPLARRAPILPALAVVWYLRAVVEWHGSWQRRAAQLAQTPARLLVDLAEMAAMARGSAEHRAPVL